MRTLITVIVYTTKDGLSKKARVRKAVFNDGHLLKKTILSTKGEFIDFLPNSEFPKGTLLDFEVRQ